MNIEQQLQDININGQIVTRLFYQSGTKINKGDKVLYGALKTESEKINRDNITIIQFNNSEINLIYNIVSNMENSLPILEQI